MIAVRYFSKLGNTKTIAEAIAEGAGVKAVSITEEPELNEPVDVLVLGGGSYANFLAPELLEYAMNLRADLVGRVSLFTVSNISRRTVQVLKKVLREKGIEVEDDYFYAQAMHIKARVVAAKAFGKLKSLG